MAAVPSYICPMPRALFHAVHQALDQRRDQEQQHAEAEQDPEAHGVAGLR